jgi:hypothetical protein
MISPVSCSVGRTTMQRAVYELDAAALHTKHPRENLLGRRCFHSCWPHERSDRHNPASSGVAGSSRRRRGLGTLEPPCAPPGGARQRGRARMSLLTWTVSDGGVHHADFGGGRYSVARTHGRVPRFVARWHRSRGQFTEGKNITGAPTNRSRQACLRAARGAADRHSLGPGRMRMARHSGVGGVLTRRR